jgi:hypothetical protein
MKNRHAIVLLATGVSALVFGVAIGICAQSASISKLAAERADLSKMDWILLNTRVHVLEQALKEDLAVPLVPTSYSFEQEKQKISISVYVSPVWLAKTNVQEANKSLSVRASFLCGAPFLAQQGEFFVSMFKVSGEKPPKDYCSIRFFTHGLDRSGNLTVKDVALYEAGQLVVK